MNRYRIDATPLIAERFAEIVNNHSIPKAELLRRLVCLYDLIHGHTSGNVATDHNKALAVRCGLSVPPKKYRESEATDGT